MRAWWAVATRRDVVLRASKTAALVGTILVVINQGDTILAGTVDASAVTRMLLTVIVPYCVSTYSSVGAILEHDRTS